jgi:hypothetical protein
VVLLVSNAGNGEGDKRSTPTARLGDPKVRQRSAILAAHFGVDDRPVFDCGRLAR